MAASLIAAALFYVRFGYDYGFGDQDEFIPLIMKWLNPSLFTHDWFIQGQVSEFGIRSFFSALVAVISLATTLDVAVLLLHFVTWVGITFALFRICNLLYNNKLISFFFVIACTVLTARWNPGGNDLIHSMLVPSSLAWALGLWSIERVLRNHFFAAGILTALALLVHPLVGLQVGTVLAAMCLWTNPRVSWHFLFPFMAVAVPMVFLFSGLGSPENQSLSAGYILTVLRAPHHYLPAYFSSAAWMKFGGLLLFGGTSVWFDRIGATRGPIRSKILFLSFTAIVILLGTLILTALFEANPLTKLQPFNIAVLLRILLLLGCSALFVHIFPVAYRLKWERVVSSTGFLSISVMVLVCAVLFGRSWFVQLKEDRSTGAPLSYVLEAKTATWIQEHTSEEAIFAVPPSLSGFQINTSRAQFVNFKAFPFSSAASEEWLRRLLLIAPVEDLEPGGALLMIRMNASYLSSEPSYWASFPELAEVDYILRPRHSTNNWPLSASSWCSSDWCVFERLALAPFSN